MANGSLAGKAQTVLGPISPDRLGVTLTHEHLLMDGTVVFSPQARASDKGFFNRPVSLDMVGRIRHYAAPNADNARILDVSTAIEEVNLYKQYGGDSLVDTTSLGLARDPIGLARISRATGVNIIMGGAYYVASTHPPEVASFSEAEITERIVQDITEGADGTNIKSGVIGEIGCSSPLAEDERKVLRASGRAQRMTGAPVTIHPGSDETAPLEIIEVLVEAGADPSCIIMGHLDRTVFLRDTLKKIAETGCYMQWDLFGIEESYMPPFYPGLNPNVDMPGDGKRIQDVAWTISEGYGRKILISQDVSAKYRLEKYGGHGYSYILGHVVPRMRARGISQEAIDDILVRNPRDALTFSGPGK